MTENRLVELNAARAKNIVDTIARIDARRRENPSPALSAYTVSDLTAKIGACIGVAAEDIDLSFVERKKFVADVAIRVPALLKTKATPLYIKEEVPRFARQLQALVTEGILERIDCKGIYLNLALNPAYLFASAYQVLELGLRFGMSDALKDERYVVDYSSPNVAKHLHAGHVRSTIIGHVLSNLYEAAGGTAYRFNYINDWGGFGEMLEGFISWSEKAPKFSLPNDLLAHIYSVYRAFEKGAGSDRDYDTMPDEVRTKLVNYVGAFKSRAELGDLFQGFKQRARERFARLEEGAADEVDLWKQIVQWSLDDFELFYGLLGIHQDFVVGESFYVQQGRELVAEGLKAGRIKKFSENDVASAMKNAQALVDAGKMGADQLQTLDQDLRRDVGAYVVELSNHRRMVVQRADGATIYATRDLAGVRHRSSIFRATQLIYEVGQEQADHFAQLFEASERLGLFGDRAVACRHIYHGFYIDGVSKKKLSSRQGASGVLSLFSDAHNHFENKYDDTSDLSADERATVARKLAIGSIIYNDLRRDKKIPVELHPDRAKMIDEFERSGGAYVIYTVCRARSILRKAGVPVPKLSEIPAFELVEIERELLKMVLDLPRRVLNAARTDNPATLITSLEQMATLYNSYYHEHAVIKGGERNLHRLVITAAVAQAIENGLSICHISCPERI